MDNQAIQAGGLTFYPEYRNFGGDRGPSIRVFGDVDGNAKQILRFDCFENDPHYHYDPTGMDAFHRIDRAVSPDTVAFALVMIRDNIAAMTKAAGYAELADSIDAKAVGECIGELRSALEKAAAEAS